MVAAPPGMVIVDMDTLFGATLKQGRLQASGIEAKVFDPGTGGYSRTTHSTSARNCQLLVATRDAQVAMHVLAIDASDSLTALDSDRHVGDGDAEMDDLTWDRPSRVWGRRSMKLAALIGLAAIGYILGSTVVSIVTQLIS